MLGNGSRFGGGDSVLTATGSGAGTGAAEGGTCIRVATIGLLNGRTGAADDSDVGAAAQQRTGAAGGQLAARLGMLQADSTPQWALPDDWPELHVAASLRQQRHSLVNSRSHQRCGRGRPRGRRRRWRHFCEHWLLDSWLCRRSSWWSGYRWGWWRRLRSCWCCWKRLDRYRRCCRGWR